MTETDRFVLQEAAEWHAALAESCRTKAEVHLKQKEDHQAEVLSKRRQKHLAVRDAITNALKVEKARVQKVQVPHEQEAKRISALFSRRPTTPWTPKEVAALKALMPIEEEDLAVVERYYVSESGKPDNYCRRDLITFLNNFTGEVDRARAWEKQKKTSARKAERAPLTGQEYRMV